MTRNDERASERARINSREHVRGRGGEGLDGGETWKEGKILRFR